MTLKDSANMRKYIQSIITNIITIQ